MSGWSLAYVLTALFFLNVLIILVSLVLAPYHAWRLLRAIARRFGQLRARRRQRQRRSQDMPLTAP